MSIAGDNGRRQHLWTSLRGARANCPEPAEQLKTAPLQRVETRLAGEIIDPGWRAPTATIALAVCRYEGVMSRRLLVVTLGALPPFPRPRLRHRPPVGPCAETPSRRHALSGGRGAVGGLPRDREVGTTAGSSRPSATNEATSSPTSTSAQAPTPFAHTSLRRSALLSAPSDADYRLRWFTPAVEVDLCGHATLASAHCLFEDGVKGPIRFATRSGVLTVSRRPDGSLAMDFPAWPPTRIDARSPAA